MVKPPTIFLRVGCVLPGGLRLIQKAFCREWASVENVAPAQLDLAVREAGWHFMWIEPACSRFGCGLTDEAAGKRAVTRALVQTKARFNAAELGVLRVSRYLGFRIAKATLHTRQIQEGASLGLIDDLTTRRLAPD